MADEAWRRGMLNVMGRSWTLPESLRALRDDPPDGEGCERLASQAELVGGLVNTVLWLMSGLQPLGGLYAAPLIDSNDARLIAREATAAPCLPPTSQLYAILTSLQISANCLYGGFLLMKRYPHASGLDALRFADGGRFLSVPASVCAADLEQLRVMLAAGGEPCLPPAWRRACHTAELLTRSALHLLCIGAVGKPASTGLPSPLLLAAGVEPGPWPGFEEWCLAWAGRFPSAR